MANNNQIYKMSNAGGFKSLTRYSDMLAGNTVWNPWQPAGAFDALATITVPSGGAASITFSGIPTGYKHLQIRGTSRISSGTNYDDQTVVRFNNDSGSNYSFHGLYGNGTTAATLTGSNVTSIQTYETPQSGTGAFNGIIMDILDYASTSKTKVSKTLIGFDNNGGPNSVALFSGLWNSTSAITSISIIPASGTWTQYTQFALYGVK